MKHLTRSLYAFACTTLLFLLGCGGSGGGNLAVVLDAEETIPEGIASGSGPEDITDGYSVSFSRYVIVVGLVDMSQSGANPQASSAVAVADYTSLPASLPELTSFDGIPIGQYSEFGFETPALDANATNVNGVSQDVVDLMIEGGLSYVIEGQLTRVSDGATKDFVIEADVPSIYVDCAVEGLEPGVNVSANASSSITMHGDHIFFNGFPANESAVTRLAQWMWDVEDTNEDDVLTRIDFEAATDVGTLFPSPQYADINSGPAGAINNAWDFIRSQLGTQGHIEGEGECEWAGSL
ncbi:MAG: hypothetical protein WBG86_17380 [Polyangiales bacterium]